MTLQERFNLLLRAAQMVVDDAERVYIAHISIPDFDGYEVKPDKIDELQAVIIQVQTDDADRPAAQSSDALDRYLEELDQ
jgi:hypothetical protein